MHPSQQRFLNRRRMRHKNFHASSPSTAKLCATGKRPRNSVRSLGEIVERYILEYRGKHEEELKFYREQPSLRKAVGLAARSIGTGGRKHPHQWRLTGETLNSAASELESVLRAIRKCRNFAALIGLLESTLENVRGIGDLTTYDIAHRVGAYLSLEPDSYICTAALATEQSCWGLTVGCSRSNLPRFLQPFDDSSRMKWKMLFASIKKSWTACRGRTPNSASPGACTADRSPGTAAETFFKLVRPFDGRVRMMRCST